MACTDSAQPVAFDTETTDLNPFRAELVGIGICWGEALDALAPWLASNNHPKTLQNAKYDRLILLRHGVALEGVVIDMLLRHQLEPWARSC